MRKGQLFNLTTIFYEYLEESRYPGSKENVCVSFYGDRAFYNGKEMNSVEAVNQITSYLMPYAMQCRCFKNGSFVKGVSFVSDIENIRSQDENDYYFDMDILNFITTLKVLANKCILDKDIVYLAVYDANEMYYEIYENESLVCLIKDTIDLENE